MTLMHRYINDSSSCLFVYFVISSFEKTLFWYSCRERLVHREVVMESHYCQIRAIASFNIDKQGSHRRRSLSSTDSPC